MKKSQLKQIIKEEIQKEIQINQPKSNKQLFDEMIQHDGETTLLDIFSGYDNFEEWYQDKDDTVDKNQEFLAKTFYKWRDNKDIVSMRVDDSDGFDEMILSKNYKRIITYGMGYNDARIILTIF